MPDEVTIDEAAFEALLTDPDGPVGQFLAEAAAQITDVARAKAPVMWRKNYWTERSNAVRPPGTTKASVHSHGPALDAAGDLYSGANAAGNPTVFLEKPAKQMHREYPFLTSGLWSVEDLLLCRGV
jgi:hypothetical protein